MTSTTNTTYCPWQFTGMPQHMMLKGSALVSVRIVLANSACVPGVF